MKKIVITGSSGFVGKNLSLYLKEQTQFQLVPLKLRSNWNGNVNEDITDVIHLAGKAHDIKDVSKPEEYYQVNYELTKKLYDAFLKSDAKKFIFISSVKAVTDDLNESLTEAHVPNPQTHYGKSKLLAEEYIKSQPLPEGKAWYILRPCMIHGTGNKGNLNLLYKFISKGFPYPLAAFENKRSFLSIENLCFVIKEILEREDILQGIYHVSDDEPLSTNELIRIIGKGIGAKPRLWNISKKWVRLLAGIGDKLKLPLNTTRLEKLTENYVIDNTKIKQAICKPFPHSSREGVLKTIRSFLNTHSSKLNFI